MASLCRRSSHAHRRPMPHSIRAWERRWQMGGPPAGLTAHIAYPSGDGFELCNVWRSEAEMRSFSTRSSCPSWSRQVKAGGLSCLTGLVLQTVRSAARADYVALCGSDEEHSASGDRRPIWRARSGQGRVRGGPHHRRTGRLDLRRLRARLLRDHRGHRRQAVGHPRAARVCRTAKTPSWPTSRRPKVGAARHREEADWPSIVSGSSSAPTTTRCTGSRWLTTWPTSRTPQRTNWSGIFREHRAPPEPGTGDQGNAADEESPPCLEATAAHIPTSARGSGASSRDPIACC